MLTATFWPESAPFSGLRAGAIDERYTALVLLAAWCGLRVGEALALTRADVDLEEGAVRIDKSAAELKSGERMHAVARSSIRSQRG